MKALWSLLVLVLLGGCAPERRAAFWAPEPRLTWQWQLRGEPDLTVDADVYQLDAFTTAEGTVRRLHAAGRRVVCYLNAGAYEDFRPDAGRYPPALLGTATGGPGERWLDIRRWDELGLVLADRVRLCHDKGFDAVNPSNVDGFLNRTGFPLTGQDQLTFNRRLAELAHRYQLAIGLENDLAQAENLEPDFDFAVNEECFRRADCQLLEPFLAAGKAVFQVEYALDPARFCPTARLWGFASIRKHAALDAWRLSC
jgi:hypothetical protein